MNTDLTKKVQVLLEFFQKIKDVKFDEETYVVSADQVDIIESYNIPYDAYGELLQLKLKRFFAPIKTIYSSHLASEIRSDEVNSDFVIVSAPGTILFYDCTTDDVLVFGIANIQLLQQCKDHVAYYHLFNYLKSQSFCDHFNSATRELVIYNSGYGIQKITYTDVPDLNNIVELSKACHELLKFAKVLEFKSFLQNAVYIIGNRIGTTSIRQVLEKYNDVLALAERDYQLAAKKFNFETFQDSLVREKNKYFTSIRDIVNKVSSQSVGIPISIGATIFTSYKISGDLPVIILIAFTFALYVIVYVTMQAYYLKDIGEVQRDFNRDFEVIRNKSGLSHDIIDQEKRVIDRKIIGTRRIIRTLVITTLILGGIVLGFMYYQWTASKPIETQRPYLISTSV